MKLFASDWNLNPCDQDLNLAKTHGTWFQDLMKLRFLTSHCRKNSVRDNVIDKKWAYSDPEGNALHRQSVGRPRGQGQLLNMDGLVFMLLFSRSVVSDSLQPHGLQQARPPCPSQSAGVCSNSCPWSRRCHPTISPSVVPFSSYPQSFPASTCPQSFPASSCPQSFPASTCPQSFLASGPFPMSWLFTSGGQSIGASASVLPMNI